MAGCCVPGCTNSTTKGYSMRSFPVNRERREQWIASIGVGKWEPTVNNRVCEAHFTGDMWEKDRCDGKRKLKSTAVPTIFPSNSAPCGSPAASKSCSNKNTNVVNMIIASLTDEGKVEIDYQYQLHSGDIKLAENGKSERHPAGTFTSANVREKTSSSQASVPVRGAIRPQEEETDWKGRCEQLTQLLLKRESECLKLRDNLRKREELFNKIIRKSYKCGNNLKKRMRKLREQNQIYDKLKTRLGEIFNEDQIKALANQGLSCREWSDETIKRAIRLRLACGSVGYQQILDQNIPLPSERTLRRKMSNVEADENV